MKTATFALLVATTLAVVNAGAYKEGDEKNSQSQSNKQWGQLPSKTKVPTTAPVTTPPMTTPPMTTPPMTTAAPKYEPHPILETKVCTMEGCVEEETKINFDLAFRPTCKNPEQIDEANCHIPVEDYSSKHGVTAVGDAVKMELFAPSGAIGSRFYVMADDKNYRMYNLVNRELTFDVDMSKMPCGLNGAFYFSEMLNDPGAQYGAGYCDAQCPGSLCCQEMDIWESNRYATGYTPHPCFHEGPYTCEEPKECGRGDYKFDFGECDMNGCNHNPYSLGTHNFFGPGANYTVDTSRPFTVVTQFLTTDGTDNGDLTEIKRLFVQDGKRIDLPVVGGTNSLNDEICANYGAYNNNVFGKRGGMKQMGKAFKNGMVMIMSIWIDNSEGHMGWLDSGDAGRCDYTQDTQENIFAQQPDTAIIYSNIRTGVLGSTTSVIPADA